MRCIVDGCTKEQRYTSKGWCATHYKRMWEYGTFEKTRIIGDDVARFWSKVNKTKGCWLWTAADNGVGYGVFVVNKKHIQAHRYGYELVKGKIPEGLYLDHLCRNPSCVNPTHLEPVDNRENQLRGNNFLKKKSGLPPGVTHSRGRYRAVIHREGKSKFLGRFNTPELAHKAYMEAI